MRVHFIDSGMKSAGQMDSIRQVSPVTQLSDLTSQVMGSLGDEAVGADDLDLFHLEEIIDSPLDLVDPFRGYLPILEVPQRISEELNQRHGRGDDANIALLSGFENGIADIEAIGLSVEPGDKHAVLPVKPGH
jgi:hypothetical protein